MESLWNQDETQEPEGTGWWETGASAQTSDSVRSKIQNGGGPEGRHHPEAVQRAPSWRWQNQRKRVRMTSGTVDTADRGP
ncbi:hypothetical protein FKM82_018122 [Ascaphus truei]